MNEEIHCIINEGKIAKNEWENDDVDFLTLQTVHMNTVYMNDYTYLLTCLKEDTSVLLKVINI